MGRAVNLPVVSASILFTLISLCTCTTVNFKNNWSIYATLRHCQNLYIIATVMYVPITWEVCGSTKYISHQMSALSYHDLHYSDFSELLHIC